LEFEIWFLEIIVFMNKNIIVVLLAVLVVGGGAFFAGMEYGKKQNAQALSFGKNFQGMSAAGQTSSGTRANRNGAGMVSGEIVSADDTSITVSVADGGSKIVFFSEKTSIGNFVDAAADDLTAGKNIVATGTANSDGSIVAANIQIGAPARQGGMPMPGAPADNEKQEDPAIQPAM